MRIASNGNIGIGTNNPIRPLHLHKNATAEDIRLCLTDNTSTANDVRGLHLVKASNNNSYLYNYENTSLIFGTNGTDRMSILANGNIGIGVTNPGFRLDVNGNVYAGNNSFLLSSYDATGGSQYFAKRDGDSGGILAGMEIENTTLGGNYSQKLHFWTHPYGSGGQKRRMTINEDGNVVIPGNLNVGSLTNPSDSRIKKDIEDINDDTALNKILLIQPTTYNYIEEERNKGFGKVYGFIAQQIREVIPEAVPIIQYVIPNIYKSCLIKNKSEVYHSIPLDTPIDTEVKIKGLTYKIKEIYEDYFVIDNDIDTDEAFVFGYNVDDFHTLNKDYIFTLNVCATQELHRRIEAQNIIIKSHEDRIKDLEEKVERLLTNT